MDRYGHEDEDKDTKKLRVGILTRNGYDPKSGDYDSRFRAADIKNKNNALEVHTTQEMVAFMKTHPGVAEIDARVLHLRNNGTGKTWFQPKSLDSKSFLNFFENDAAAKIRARKGSKRVTINREGGFSFDRDGAPGGSLLGNDFTPLLGGPYYKNLYFYTDYIRMHAEAFFTYHNDPIARALTSINKHFVLGTGYEVQCDTSDTQGKLAMAAWRAFEEVNKLQEQIERVVDESDVYGEILMWKLPGNQTKITYQLGKGDKAPIGMIPRVRLVDPSNIVEIVTYPEDIERPLFYVWMQPTQYQIFGSGTGSDDPKISKLPQQPSLKFIYRQIPAEQMLHMKLNCMSNEKRGRSSYFPIFNYLKRLRDAVDFQMVSLEKVAAWAIDTTIEGDQGDIDRYIAAQKAMGTIPPAGSEFVHSKAITRNYQGNQHAAHSSSDVLQWCLSFCCAGYGYPQSWLGTHLSGGGTRASALVATEPAAKKTEYKREIIKRFVKQLWEYCMESAGLPSIDCDVVMAEIITQDRSGKLKDLQLAQQMRWMSPKRCAEMAAKEFQAQKYDYETELEDMKAEIPEIPMPLLDPGTLSPVGGVIPNAGGSAPPGDGEDPGTAGLTSDDKNDVKKQDTTL